MCLLWILLTAWCVMLACDAHAENSSPPPNVLLIVTDDQGWGDLGVNGNDKIRTPNLDRLAHQGVQLSRFYVSPVSAPTQA